MNNAIRWLRISYWLGALLDTRSAIGLSQTFLSSLTVQDFRGEFGIAAALMWGWTFLLIWADRQPLERKGIVLLTLVPVLVLLGINMTAQQILVPATADYTVLIPVGVAALIFIYSYWNAVRAEKRLTAA